MRMLDKTVPHWVNYGVGRLFSSGDEDAQNRTPLPRPSPGKKPTKEPKRKMFPDELDIALYTNMHAQMNRGRCKSLAEKLRTSGRPTYENARDGTSAISTADLAAVWTNHRVEMLRSGKKLQQVIASRPGLWMRHLARPDDGIDEMREEYKNKKGFDPGPEGFERILGHILEEVEKH